MRVILSIGILLLSRPSEAQIVIAPIGSGGGTPISLPLSLADGGTGESLADPGADRILFWDDSAGAVTWLTVGTNLTITDTTLDASGAGGAAWGSITGTLSDQTDLQTALDAKAPLDSPTFTTLVNIESAGVRFTAADGVLTLLGLGNGNDENLTIDFDNAAANAIALASGTGANLITWTGALQIGASSSFSFGTSVYLAVDTDNVLAQRNSTNAQTFRVYETYTDAVNNAGIEFDFSVGWLLKTFENGTGLVRSLTLAYSDGTDPALFIPNSNSQTLTLADGAANSAFSTGLVQIGIVNTNATSGTTVGLNVAYNAIPSSTSTLNLRSIQITPTINFSAGTPGAGSYTLIYGAVTETALPTGTNYLMRFFTGATGTTEVFAVDRAGIVQAFGGYKSADGTTGVTVTSCTGFKNGLCISGT